MIAAYYDLASFAAGMFLAGFLALAAAHLAGLARMVCAKCRERACLEAWRGAYEIRRMASRLVRRFTTKL